MKNVKYVKKDCVSNVSILDGKSIKLIINVNQYVEIKLLLVMNFVMMEMMLDMMVVLNVIMNVNRHALIVLKGYVRNVIH